MLTSPLLSGNASSGLILTLSADDNNVNVIDELEAIYGAGCCDGGDVVVVVTILPGVEIWSNNASYPALDFSGFDFGASLKLVNYGNVYGKGGTGNAGAGGTALNLSRNITINNTTTGHIYGGGGGGGRGGFGWCNGPDKAGGGGGGGGQGRSGGAGGDGEVYAAPGAAGAAGSSSAPGAYGAGGIYSETCAGGRGGTGGTWGGSGEDGSTGYGYFGGQTGQPGGAAGKAIEKNGATITWVAGNNSTQVKGVVD